ncbi:glycosyltransferase family 4 protein [Cohnella rhizosphaerae]|uniref:Glycosyltransferase family 4 protein n=1 Tax=Cohnella rhizosphaerae TaxID=1457232 RepID=A0A9X4QRV8_9BACL|nr:glycosyltransferase family 4 protein [Cohnella rhizosphaerae]MDG0808678.1 glycosyltransferase family 4 protein [Cohnella rhizosphaerae]
MRVLFSYLVPSGGMETLNRLRAEALIRHGVDCRIHYQLHGSGLQNNTSGVPVYVTNDDYGIWQMLQEGRFDAVIISNDFHGLERMRRLGFAGTLLFEVQGLGTRQMAVETLLGGATYMRAYANGLLYPQTAHLIELFRGMFSDMPQFCFDNPLDVERFGYHPVPIHSNPILGWVGRIEPNKNWRAYLQIGAELRRRGHDVHLWTFEDAALNRPEEQEAFEQTASIMGLAPVIRRHSNVPNLVMSDYYSIIGDSGGLLASTSILEGFGYAVGEAMLCRCPVVAADSDGVRAFVEHSLTGLLYAQEAIGVAADLAEALLLDAGFRERIRADGRQHAVARFAPAHYVGNFLQVLRAFGLG